MKDRATPETSGLCDTPTRESHDSRTSAGAAAPAQTLASIAAYEAWLIDEVEKVVIAHVDLQFSEDEINAAMERYVASGGYQSFETQALATVDLVERP